MAERKDAKPDRTAKNPDEMSAEDMRQGRVVLYNRPRKLIFFGGLALLVIIVLAIRFAG